jgi:hypothetical protein
LLSTGVSVADPAWTQLVRGLVEPHVVARGAEPVRVQARPPVYALLASEVEGQLREEMAKADTPTVSVEVESTTRDIDDATVIARLPGEVDPAQTILLLAPWDAGGHRPAASEGAGAEDNAVGVAMALAIAQRLSAWAEAGRRTRRSVTLVFTAADSIGARGTKLFVETRGGLSRDVPAVVVLRGFELDEPGARLVLVGAERTGLGPLVVDAFADRLHRAEAGSAQDSRQRVLLDEAGLSALSFTRRVEGRALDDAPIDPASDLHDLAVETDAIFDLVWSLATVPSVPTPVPADPEEPAPTP